MKDCMTPAVSGFGEALPSTTFFPGVSASRRRLVQLFSHRSLAAAIDGKEHGSEGVVVGRVGRLVLIDRAALPQRLGLLHQFRIGAVARQVVRRSGAAARFHIHGAVDEV